MEDKVTDYFVEKVPTNAVEDFIRKYDDKIYWPRIGNSQILSDDFIREFQDKFDMAWNK